MTGAVDQLVKEGAVVVRRIHKAKASGHVNGVRARAVVCSLFGFACEVKTRMVLPSVYDGFARLVFVNIVGKCGLDLGKTKAVALLDIENGVIAKHKGCDVARFCQPVITEDFSTSANSLGVR